MPHAVAPGAAVAAAVAAVMCELPLLDCSCAGEQASRLARRRRRCWAAAAAAGTAGAAGLLALCAGAAAGTAAAAAAGAAGRESWAWTAAAMRAAAERAAMERAVAEESAETERMGWRKGLRGSQREGGSGAREAAEGATALRASEEGVSRERRRGPRGGLWRWAAREPTERRGSHKRTVQMELKKNAREDKSGFPFH